MITALDTRILHRRRHM